MSNLSNFGRFPSISNSTHQPIFQRIHFCIPCTVKNPFPVKHKKDVCYIFLKNDFKANKILIKVLKNYIKCCPKNYIHDQIITKLARFPWKKSCYITQSIDVPDFTAIYVHFELTIFYNINFYIVLPFSLRICYVFFCDF